MMSEMSKARLSGYGYEYHPASNDGAGRNHPGDVYISAEGDVYISAESVSQHDEQDDHPLSPLSKAFSDARHDEHQVVHGEHDGPVNGPKQEHHTVHSHFNHGEMGSKDDHSLSNAFSDATNSFENGWESIRDGAKQVVDNAVDQTKRVGYAAYEKFVEVGTHAKGSVREAVTGVRERLHADEKLEAERKAAIAEQAFDMKSYDEFFNEQSGLELE